MDETTSVEHCCKGGFTAPALSSFSLQAMNQQIKQRWIEALKSGEYQQGHEALRYDNKFCCLGVLTDLYIKEHGLQWHKGVGECWSFDDKDGLLASSVQKWAGLSDADPVILGDCATELNDGTNASFEEIASYIEQDTKL